MERLVLSRQPLPLPGSCSSPSPAPRRRFPTRIRCSPLHSPPPPIDAAVRTTEYQPGVLDDLFFSFFRSKMVEGIMLIVIESLCQICLYRLSNRKEVKWDSQKPGYDGLIEVANRLMMKGRTNAEVAESAVRVLKSLFPPFLLELFQLLIAPIGGGKVAAVMSARATAFSCQWLMGRCSVNSVDLPDGSSCKSGVFIERCRYLEEAKCVGICINTCRQPTQVFFKDCMGVPLTMEPNFKDYSCQFKFGVPPPHVTEDKFLMEPCLEICPTASRRRVRNGTADIEQCPKA